MGKQLFWILVALTVFVGFLVHKDPTSAADISAAEPALPSAAFTSGNIVVYRVGDGIGTLINTGNPIFLDEYTPTGTLVQSVAIPTAASGNNKPCISGGTSTSEGLLNRSTDGNYLVFTGYATTTGGSSSLSGTTATAVNRCVGRVDASANVDTSTALTDFATSSSPRSAASDNGVNLWVAGGAGGVRYTTLGSTTSTQLSTTVTNLRAAEIYGGQLYTSDSSGTTVRIGSVGTGLPTTAGQTITNLPGFRVDGSPYQFALLDLNSGVAGVDTLYYAEDGASSGGSQPAGVYKYSLVGGSWVANGMVAVTGAVGLTASASGSTVNVYVTNGSTLQSIVDTTGYNGSISASPTILATAATNTAFRGIALAPGAAVAAPTITGVSPNSGPQAGGTSVTITGTNFTGATAVKFGSTNATAFTVNSATLITATSPAGTGTVDVTVTTPGGTSATSASDQFTYTAPAPPTVTGVSPTSGATTGGTSVTITGTGFVSGATVSFGGSAGTGVTVVSPTQITVTSPAHAAGAVDVTVTTTNGTSATSANDVFTYVAPAPPTVTGVSPTSGTTAGGTPVTITGTGFVTGATVSFGGSAGTGVTVVSPTQITVNSPAHAAGVVDVTVTTTNGTSAISASDQYTYVAPAPPTVTGVSPTSGSTAGGTLVTITGTGFVSGATVSFGGSAGTGVTVVSGTQITVTSPAHAAGVVDVTVTTTNGTSAISASDQFTYNTPVASTIAFSTNSYVIDEGGGHIDVTVTRTGDTSAAATVDYATSDGTAVQKSDYEIALGTVKFAAGETSKTFTVLIVDDKFVETGNEILNLTLSNPTGTNAVLGTPSAATLTILDNDSASTTANPYDDTAFFVRQQYLDFLNREPDASGYAFWQNEINQCGTNAQCIDVKRVNVSAAFFVSNEFQTTGFEAIMAHRAAFGTLTPNTPIPVVYTTFMHDNQELGKGYIFGAPGDAAVIEANKVAYFADFTTTAAFLAKYPLSLTNAQYVDAILTTAGLPTNDAFRTSLVNGLGNGSETRASVMRKIAEDSRLKTREFNNAFVLMEYFGYLRRDPNASPDTDYSGYNFWLNKLNAFGGNYVTSEMVKAFITATETRGRFGNP